MTRGTLGLVLMPGRGVHATCIGCGLTSPASDVATVMYVRNDGTTRCGDCVERSTQGLALLTRRESSVLRLVARGLSNAEIGEALGVRVTTVRGHIKHTLSKIGVQRRVQAIVFAYESGFVPVARPVRRVVGG